MSPRAAPKGLRAKGGRFIPGHRWAACARTNSRVVGISQPPEKNQCYATERGWGSSPVQCPSCNLSAPEGSKFCGNCGTALPRACPNCGHAVPPENSFCSECGTSIGAKKVASPPSPTHRAAPATAERRQLTIMFCDMVGSSALATRLDPEEQGNVIAAFHACCADEIKSFGGTVAQYLGDGVLAYFGYPTAHENDAERAILAGLAILKAVGGLKAGGVRGAARGRALPADRPAGGDRAAAAPLGSGQARRGSGRAALR